MLSAIIAAGSGNEIGYKGGMPWHLPKDLAFFKKMTFGHTIIMGRKTFESLPGLLPGRTHVVITRNKSWGSGQDITVYHDIKTAANQYAAGSEECFIIGGAEIFAEFFPYVKNFYITHIHKQFDADTFLKGMDWRDFRQTGTSPVFRDSASGTAFHWALYQKRNEP